MLDEIRNFYERTKFNFSQAEQTKPDFIWPLNWVKIFFKTYPRMGCIKLDPSPKVPELSTALGVRRSVREFRDDSISFRDLSDLLVYSSGIRNVGEKWEMTKRYYPSAGARYPIETYLIANNTFNLANGLYHLNVKENALEPLLSQDLREESQKIFGVGNYEKNPNFLVLTGVMSRTEVKYGVNAYRFACLEAGHLGQNLSLISAEKGIGCCGIGGFDNDRLVKLLDLTEDEIPVYALAIGIPKDNP